jgi:excisionase family DNA binding protein
MPKIVKNIPTPFNERVAVSVSRAVEIIGIGRTKLYEFIESGELKTVKIGGRRLVPLDAIRAFVAEAAQ